MSSPEELDHPIFIRLWVARKTAINHLLVRSSIGASPRHSIDPSQDTTALRTVPVR